MTDAATLQKTGAAAIILDYLQQVHSLYGMYLDASGGFAKVHELFESLPFNPSNPDPRIFMGSFDDPNESEATYQHSATKSQLLARNSKNGLNTILLGRACICFVFFLWEATTRKSLAAILEMDENDVKSDVMGDIRIYRNSIAHNSSRLKSPTKIFNHFSVDQALDFSTDQIEKTMEKLFADLVTLAKTLTEIDLGSQFSRKLNRPTKKAAQ